MRFANTTVGGGTGVSNEIKPICQHIYTRESRPTLLELERDICNDKFGREKHYSQSTCKKVSKLLCFPTCGLLGLQCT